ncbi:HAMP domain-containing protein [Reinekea forsetii]|nr:HAMP domain-containing protein [Reinekea forsetii]
MFYSLRTKLFLSILFINTLLIATVLWLNSTSFNQNFADYVNKQEARRLQPLLESLAAYNQRNQGWQALQNNPKQWVALINLSYPTLMSDRRRFSPRPPYLERLLLKSEQGELIVGREDPNKRFVWVPITNEASGTLGYIGYQPNERLDAQVDNIFRTQYKEQIRWIAVALLITSAVFAIFISGVIARPLRKVSTALAEMAAGNYHQTITHNSQDELGQLAQDVKQLADTLQENQKSRSQWVTDIAHELRTPIAVLLADIESAQDGIRETNEDWLKSLQWQAERMGRLVNDLNELSGSEVGALQYKKAPVDLKQLMFASLEQYSSRLNESNIKLSMSTKGKNFLAFIDEQRIEQLFSNLMQNTLRYTDSPGQLSLQLLEQDSMLLLTWSDSSPGVEETEFPKLFDRLYRVDSSRNRKTGGSGLGLAIVKNIVHAHQGTVVAKSSELGGVTIELTLPKAIQE